MEIAAGNERVSHDLSGIINRRCSGTATQAYQLGCCPSIKINKEGTLLGSGITAEKEVGE
jgi:hypothetical protein